MRDDLIPKKWALAAIEGTHSLCGDAMFFIKVQKAMNRVRRWKEVFCEAHDDKPPTVCPCCKAIEAVRMICERAARIVDDAEKIKWESLRDGKMKIKPSYKIAAEIRGMVERRSRR